MILFTSLLFLWLPLTMAANSTYTPCDPCVDEASSSDLAEMKLRLFAGPTIDNYTTVSIGEPLELLDEMDNNKPTIVYIYGYVGFDDLYTTTDIIKAFFERGDHNILLLEYATFTGYIYAARSAEGRGYTLAMALNELVAGGLNTTGMNLIGHSLGAQICGYTGRYVNFTLDQITGLDPAGPEFYEANTYLSSNDAEFVLVMHTDAGGLGHKLQTGHADFYFNGGTSNQPGCLTLNICSHLRCPVYYSESATNENSFIARACDSYEDFEAGSCDSNATVVAGYATPSTARGRFYLQTNKASPYGKGTNGTTYAGATETVVTKAVVTVLDSVISLV